MKQFQLSVAVFTITACAIGISKAGTGPLALFFAAVATAYIQGRWGN